MHAAQNRTHPVSGCLSEGCMRIGHEHPEHARCVGNALYVSTWARRQHSNTSLTGSALYVAYENGPMLQSLGIASREEVSMSIKTGIAEAFAGDDSLPGLVSL